MTTDSIDGPHPIARRGLMLILSSPSGAGKTTISRALLKSDGNITMSISVTTRPPRPGEEHGKDYFFITEAEYHRMVKAGELLEHARVFDNFYGTPRAYVEKQLVEGHDVLFDIDWQGTQQLKASAGGDVVSVFVLPPSIEELEKRLRGRAQDSEDVVRKRMSRASHEMSHWPEYDYVVVNRTVEQSIAQVNSVLVAERLRQRRRAPGLVAFVNSMRGET
ncbi:MAG: guanylate kinase [Proteobacteria bacterium]|nr:guanylate kinase [Pseudomonadota bacterium]